MSGYQDNYSKSNNAACAEQWGRFPATTVAKMFGLPVAFIREHFRPSEWHHVSKFYNTVDYFDAEAVQAWADGAADALDEHDGLTLIDALAAWKAAQRAKTAAPVKVHAGVSVIWLEWSGTRRYRSATVHQRDACTVTDAGGKFVTVTFADGRVMKKGRDTNGFKLLGADGRRIWL